MGELEFKTITLDEVIDDAYNSLNPEKLTKMNDKLEIL